MARETIVVIDAGPNLEEKITATLEAAGYTVFTGPSGVVGADVLRNLAPALIYIKPLAPSRAGFEPCKTIHAHPGLKHIPIVLLASLKGSLDARYFNIYGIVDSLKLSFAPEELIEKTEMVLGKNRPSWLQGQDQLVAEKPSVYPDEAEPGIGGKDRPKSEASSVEAMQKQEEEPDGLTWLMKGGKEDREEKAARPAPWSQAPGKRERRRPSILIAGVGAAILLVIVGAVIWLYQPSAPPRKAERSPAPVAPPPVPPKAPESRPEPAPPPPPKTADTPTPSTAVSQSVKAPSPSPDSAPRATRKPVYFVQVGVFRNEGNAQTFEKDFRQKGYDVSIRTSVAGDGSPLYRVLAGKFDDRKAAEKLAEEIQSKENIKPAVRRE